MPATVSSQRIYTIKEYKPNVFGRIKEKLESPSKNIFGKIAKGAGKAVYNIADNVSVYSKP